MSTAPRTRDREKTRGKIVVAARAEFAAKGFSGARMEQIAEGAGVNKELIYHYFKGKESLFEEVRSAQIAEAEADHAFTPSPLLDSSHDIPELFAWRFNRMLGDLEWVKLLTWEAVQAESVPPPNEDARRSTIQRAISSVRSAQRSGLVPAEFDPKLLQLAIFALATYPLAFSQITLMTTGLPPSDKTFQNKWAEFLRQIGEKLLTAAANNTPKSQRSKNAAASNLSSSRRPAKKAKK